MAVTTPTTVLEAVNELLTAIGTAPVNTLDVPGLTDAAIAKDTIEAIAREVQTQRWWFNETQGYILTPSSGVINVPAGAVSVSPSGPSSSSAGEPTQWVIREGKLWNTMTNTYTWATTVRADIVWLFEFESLPETARRYVTVRAARIFQTKVLGDEQLGVFTSVHEQECFANLERDHIMSKPSSIFKERMLQRFQSVRPNPVGHGPQQPQQQRQG